MSNQVTQQEFSDGLFEAIAEQRFVAGRYLVLDFQGYHEHLSSEELRFFASQLVGIKERFSQPVICIVSDSLHFGLMRMLDAFSSTLGFEIKIFRNERDALNFFPVCLAEKNEPYQECL